MSCKATLTDLVEALTQSMSVVETAKTALHIELSQIIREARKQLNLSQKELAEKSGTSLRMVQLYEQRKQDIRKAEAQTLVNLSRVLGCGVKICLTEIKRDAQRKLVVYSFSAEKRI